MHNKMKGRVRKSLRASLMDGVFASGMIGMVENYIIPYALAFRAQAPQIGLLASLPNLVAALAQSRAEHAERLAGGRKTMLRAAVFIQAAAVLGMPALAFLPSDMRVTGLMFLAILYTTFGGLSAPPWGSLMCEYLPLSRRSGYFGWRNRITGLVIIACGLAAGGVLQIYGTSAIGGFLLIFSLAAVCRLISWHFLGKMHEPPLVHGPPRGDAPSPAPQRPNRNLRSFLAYSAAMSCAVNVAGPFFPVYMLQELRLGYMTFTVLTVATTFTTFTMMDAWGRHADHAGNLRVIRVSSFFLPAIPLLWLLSSDPAYLFCIQLASGVVWAGYNLCTSNFIYDSAPPAQRVGATGDFNMVNGFSIFIGAFLGSHLLILLPPLYGSRFFSLLVLSAALRLLALWAFLPRIREVREVAGVKSLDLFYSVIGIKPMPGISRGALRL